MPVPSRYWHGSINLVDHDEEKPDWAHFHTSRSGARRLVRGSRLSCRAAMIRSGRPLPSKILQWDGRAPLLACRSEQTNEYE